RSGAPAPRGIASQRYANPGPLRKRRPEVTRGLERIVMHAREVAPDRRPADASVLCNYLWGEITLEGRASSRVAAALWPRAWAKRLAVGGGLAAMGALVTWLAYASVTPHGRPASTPRTGSSPASVESPRAPPPAAPA